MIWDLLKQIQNFHTHTDFRIGGIIGYCHGPVNIEHVSADEIIYKEKGILQGKLVKQFSSERITRWRLCDNNKIQIARYKYQEFEHMLTFDTIINNHLSASTPFCCGKDIYVAELNFEENFLRLYWRVLGPKKNGSIITHYFNAESNLSVESFSL